MHTSAMTSAPVPSSHYLARPGGRIAYEVAGEGPLVVLVPGMGDLRASYRLLAPLLVASLMLSVPASTFPSLSLSQ